MCTFLLAWRVFADAPVVVAANRDEAVDRPSTPPAVRDGDPRVVAPRDERDGGTWIGVNERGVVVAVTNRWTDADLSAERSRGLLVDDALAANAAEDAARAVERTVEDVEYDGFNLVAVDGNAALLLEWDGRLRVRNLEPGVHVVVNVGADGDYDLPGSRREAAADQADGANRARADLRPEPGERVAAWRERARAVLRDHDYGFCVHGDGFGTRSSSLITVSADGDVEYLFADGPPCERGYDPVDADL